MEAEFSKSTWPIFKTNGQGLSKKGISSRALVWGCWGDMPIPMQEKKLDTVQWGAAFIKMTKEEHYNSNIP